MRFLSAVIAVLLFSGFAHAYQNSAQVGSCATLDSPNTDYYMTHDIDGSAYAPLGRSFDGCINITAQNVTFDGMGHTISGGDRVEVFGIYATSSNVLVKNVVTDGFYAGIEFFGANNSTMTNITVKRGGLVSNYGKGVLVNNSSSNGSAFGFYGRNNDGIVVNGNSFASSSDYVIYAEGWEGKNYFIGNRIRALASGTYALKSATTHADYFGNTIIADRWVAGTAYGNFNNSTAGNAYYLLDGTPSWSIYGISGILGVCPDGRSAYPFSSATVGKRWTGTGTDFRPYVPYSPDAALLQLNCRQNSPTVLDAVVMLAASFYHFQ